MLVNVRELTNAPDEALPPLLVSLFPGAARALGVERSTVIKLADAGEIETVKIGRRRLAVVESLTTFVERKRAAAA